MNTKTASSTFASIQGKSTEQQLDFQLNQLKKGQSIAFDNGTMVKVSLKSADEVFSQTKVAIEPTHIIINKPENISLFKGVYATQVFRFLSVVLSPGPITYKLSEKVECTISNDPLVEHIYANNLGLLIVEEEVAPLQGFPHTLLDVSKIGKVSLLRPGLIDFDEICSISPIIPAKDFNSASPIIKRVKQSQLETVFQSYQDIFAPREIISELHPELNHMFFRHIDDSARHYSNLGSLKSPKDIISGLYNHISTSLQIKQYSDRNSEDLGQNSARSIICWVESAKPEINELAYYVLNDISIRYADLVDCIIIERASRKNKTRSAKILM